MKEELNIMPYTPITIVDFCGLTQKKMLAELRRFDEHHNSNHARGLSRAKKEDLAAAYQVALESLPSEPAPEPTPAPSAEGVKTGRLRSDQPNEANKPQADPEEKPEQQFPMEKIFLRNESGVFFFVRPGTGSPKRPLSSKESWLLGRVKTLREAIGPVYVDPGSRRRANPTKEEKSELRSTLRRLLKPHGLVVVTDEAVKRMQEAQQSPEQAAAQ